jgi:hypothetical protein
MSMTVNHRFLKRLSPLPHSISTEPNAFFNFPARETVVVDVAGVTTNSSRFTHSKLMYDGFAPESTRAVALLPFMVTGVTGEAQ